MVYFLTYVCIVSIPRHKHVKDFLQGPSTREIRKLPELNGKQLRWSRKLRPSRILNNSYATQEGERPPLEGGTRGLVKKQQTEMTRRVL
jgi:hypothetical protein